MSIGAAIIISLLVGFFFTAYIVKDAKIAADLPQEMILLHRINGPIPEGPPKSGLDALGPQRLSLNDIILSLEAAATDKRVKALIFSVRRSELAFSQIQELRKAVIEFRKRSGKPAYIYSMSYGEAGQGLALYSLASAFDEIWLSPLGTVSINGLQIEQPYMRGLLNRLGIEPQFLQREEYKGVFENFTNENMSEPSRESLKSLSKSLVRELLKEIMISRPILQKDYDLSKLVNKGIFLDTEAEEKGLVDRVEYGDVLLDDLRERLNGSIEDKTPKVERLSRYFGMMPPPAAKESDIALIYIQGPIMVVNEEQESNSLLGSTQESADSIASLIVNAAEDENVKSIVLRVDSPGGSPTASELIRRAIIRAQNKEKVVIVSMGSMAASGGYWVASPADYIFALPGTITGSIGVAGGKVSMKQLWENIDVNWDEVGIGRNAGLYSLNTPFSNSERALIEASMDRIYDMFLGVVAEGRMMTKEDVREVAKGRIWTGSQALEKGLVDELGDLNDALDYAAELSGYKSRKDVNIQMLPKPKTPLEEVLEILQKTAGLPIFLQQQAALWDMMMGNGVQKKILQDAAVMQNSGSVFVYEPLSPLN